MNSASNEPGIHPSDSPAILVVAVDGGSRPDYYQREYPIDLPAGADFVHWDPEMTPHMHGPFVRALNGFDGDLTSRGMSVVGDVASSQYILFGAVTCHRSATHVTVHREQFRLSHVTISQREIAPEGIPEEIVILRGSDWRDLLVRYADLVADRMQASVPDVSSNFMGYCSWYYSYQQVTETEFMTAITEMRAHHEIYPASLAQIDDGYQVNHGDWLERNEHWTTQFPDLVSRINAMGLTAGIWTMPLIACTESSVFRNHPNWFVTGADGHPLTVLGWSPKPRHLWACLDASHPEVIQHLKRTFSQLQAWGFRYFKLDGLGMSAPRGKRHDPSATGMSAFRAALAAIREATPGSTILSCGSLLPSVGLVDLSRVGSDTGKTWRANGIPTETNPVVAHQEIGNPQAPCLENAVKIALGHWWQFDRWYRADPDVVMVRQENTRLTEGEARISLLTAMLTGVMLTSDRLGRLDATRIDLLKRACRLRLRDVRPLAMKQDEFAYAFQGRTETGMGIAVFNFSTQPFEMILPLPPGSQATELFSGGRLDTHTGRITAHDAAFFAYSVC